MRIKLSFDIIKSTQLSIEIICHKEIKFKNFLLALTKVLFYEIMAKTNIV